MKMRERLSTSIDSPTEGYACALWPLGQQNRAEDMWPFEFQSSPPGPGPLASWPPQAGCQGQ